MRKWKPRRNLLFIIHALHLYRCNFSMIYMPSLWSSHGENRIRSISIIIIIIFIIAVGFYILGNINWKFIVSIILYTISILISFLSIKYYLSIQDNMSWVAVDGTLITSQIKRISDSDYDGFPIITYRPIIEYKYEFDSKSYVSDQLFPTGILQGYNTIEAAEKELNILTEELIVFVDPKNHENAALTRSSFSQSTMLLFVISGILSIIPFTVWIFSRKKIINPQDYI